jgi:tetratricopeptide (TPR) repeat protein
MLARQHDQTKNYGEAEAAYEKAFRAKPDYKKGLIEYADFLFKIQKFDRSLELIEGVRGESDLKFAYFFIKGKALMGIEKHDEAIKNFLEGNQIYNSDIGLLNALGFCYYKTGQKEKALEVLGASIKMNPQQPDVKELIDKIEK